MHGRFFPNLNPLTSDIACERTSQHERERCLAGMVGPTDREGRDLSQTKGNSKKRGMVKWYRVNHQLADLGWVDCDLDVPSILPNLLKQFCQSLMPRQNRADSGIAKIKVNPTQVCELMVNPVLMFIGRNQRRKPSHRPVIKRTSKPRVGRDIVRIPLADRETDRPNIISACTSARENSPNHRVTRYAMRVETIFKNS